MVLQVGSWNWLESTIVILYLKIEGDQFAKDCWMAYIQDTECAMFPT